ncbi:MAG: hypothetical protein LBD23_06245, partial [Oscillospiraceae bacterium]|nr:hypothetical protein [Oscillospiraceae bacterium]
CEQYDYDKNGNIIKVTDVLGSVTTVSYDCLDRIKTITNALGHTKKFSYDALGNITSITDESDNETKYIYSSTGELIEVIDAMCHSTKYDYDKAGRMTRMEQYRVIDETYADLKQIELQVTTWERNKRGDIVKKTAPLDGESSYRYDALGNLISQTDEDGLETLYEYNLASTLTKVAYADGKTVELGYNPLRQLTELKDWLGTTAIELDPVGRATKVTDHEGREIGYTWDALGRRESIMYPDKSKVDYSYDISGRIEQVRSETGTTQYSYSISDRLLERVMPGNIVTQQKADLLGRIESLTHKQNDEILDSFKYSYDQTGNITQIDKHRNGIEADSGLFSYSYDKLGRLTEANNNNGNKQYRYDSLGNRIMSIQNGIQTQHSYNVRNQLIKTTEGEAVKEYGYDKRGNLTSIIENGMTTSSFTFNAANRMVEAITSKGKAEYEYNGFLKRVSKLETLQQDGTSIPDPLQEVKYTLDLTKPYNDLLSIGEQRFVWGNELVASEGSDNNKQFSYLSDHLGSPIRLVGDSQAETLSYDEFGVPIVDTTSSISINSSKHPDNTNNFHNPFGFTGYQSDNVSDLYYAQARYYVPNVGRFGATDVIKGYDIWPATLNEYSYCLNNPKVYKDPDGEFIITALVVGIVVGAVVGGAIGGVNAHQKDENVITGVIGGAAIGAVVGGAIGLTGGVAIKALAPAAAIATPITSSSAIATAGTSFIKGGVIGVGSRFTQDVVANIAFEKPFSSPNAYAMAFMFGGLTGGIKGSYLSTTQSLTMNFVLDVAARPIANQFINGDEFSWKAYREDVLFRGYTHVIGLKGIRDVTRGIIDGFNHIRRGGSVVEC